MKSIIYMREAKSALSQLVQRTAADETILIGPHGRAEANLVAVDTPTRAKRHIGLLKGKLKVPDDFDVPLSDDVLDSFEGNT